MCVGFAACQIVKHYNRKSFERKLVECTNEHGYLKGGYPETMDAARPIFKRFVNDLIKIGPDAKQPDKYALIKQLTYDLYHLDQKVETVERDIFYSTTCKIAAIAGIGLTPKESQEFESNLEKWRD